MNQFLFVVVVALASVTGHQAADAACSPAPVVTPPAGDTRTVSLKVEKMMCQSCAGRIRETLTKVEGVQQVEAVPADKTVTVKFDASKTDAAKLIAELKKAGFDALEVKA